MSEAEAEDIAAIKPAGGNKIVPLLLGVNSVALVGVLAVVLMRSGGGSAAAAKPAAAEGEHAAAAEGAAAEAETDPSKPGPTVHLSDFTARLHGTEADRYARISIELEVANDKDKEELTNRIPQIRDSFIRFFSDMSLEDLTGGEGIDRTKAKLVERLHAIVPPKMVRELYITDLVVQ